MSYKIPVIFTCFILASLWPGPRIAGCLSKAFGSAYAPILYGICAAAAIALIIIWFRKRPTLWSSTWLVIVFILSGVVSYMMVCANEIIHLVEYAILGYLFAAVPAVGVIWSLVIASGIGILDEVIQFLLPNRYFELRDVAMNIVSVVVGVIIYPLLNSRG